MPRRSIKSAIIFCAIFLSFYSYFCFQLFGHSGNSFFESLPWMLVLFLMLASIASLPLYFFVKPGARAGRSFKRFVFFIYFSMAYLTFLWLLIGARDLAALLARGFSHSIFTYSHGEGLVLLALALSMVGLGAFLAQAGPIVKKIRIPHRNLPAEFDGYHIAQISDLHIGATVGESSVAKVVAITNALKPNLVVMTGDIFDGYLSEIEKSCEPLRGLRAPDGIYFVPGNHEYYFGLETNLTKARELGFHVLLNDFQKIERDGAVLVVSGVPDRVAASMGETPADLAELRKNIREDSPKNAFTVFLDHQPNRADEAASLGFDLQLSGHTHNGQFLPWVWVVKFVQKYSKGLYRLGDLRLYVNSGAMYWGPPIRLGSVSEITSIRLESEK